MIPTPSLRRLAPAGAVAAALLVLAGCAGSPAASPTPSAPATASAAAPAPSSSPEAEVEDASPAEIVLSARGFEILGDDGVSQFEYTWAEDGQLAVDALEDAFGAAPVTSVRQGDGTHFPDYALYTWDGLSFADAQDLGPERAEYPHPSYLEFTAEQSRGLVLRTSGGISVGATAESVRALGPATSWYVSGAGGRYLFDVEDPDAVAAGQPAGVAVMAESDVDDALIVVVSATYDSGL